MMEERAEIRRLRRSEGMAIKAIARRLGLARNTVRAALAADAPPRYERAPGGSRADAFEPAIRALLAQFPEMPATVIAERIGWEHAPSVLRARVAELRPLYRPADPRTARCMRPGRSCSATCGSRAGSSRSGTRRWRIRRS
jgi:transposase